MTNRSTTGKGRAISTLATAVLLCGIAGTWPADARDRGPDFGGADSQYGYRRYGDASDDRRSGPYGYRSDLDRLGREEFERGYRAGREDERLEGGQRGGGAGGTRGRFADLGWNDPRQNESRERLERAAARLREALVLMQRQPPGPQLVEALEQARQALTRVQNAMTWLPRNPDTEDGEDQRRYERRSGQGTGAHRAFGGLGG